MKVIKRDKQVVDFQPEKIRKAIESCFSNINTVHTPYEVEEMVLNELYIQEGLFIQDHEEDEYVINVEDIQDLIEKALMSLDEYAAAKHFILYRERHKNARFIEERLKYMDNYVKSSENASTSSETDANANVAIKNVSNLEGEVYKTTNRIIQRKVMKRQLQKDFPEVADQYEQDIEKHICYVHDEASTPTRKNYCEAVTLYPLMTEGIGNIDGVTPGPPQNLSSFCGQFINLAFALSAQCKGAVAFGGLFVVFNYYCVKEYGEDYYKRINNFIYSSEVKRNKTIQDSIIQYFQQIIWMINQPSGNRSYQSP